MIATSYSAERGLVCRPSRLARSRTCGRTMTCPSASSAGPSPSCGRGPGQSAANSGASGVSQLKEIWLRARKRRKVGACRVPALAHQYHARLARFVRDALEPSNALARERADLQGDRLWIRQRSRNTPECPPASPVTVPRRDNHPGRVYQAQLAPRQKSCREARQPSVRSTPSIVLMTSILPLKTANKARSPPFGNRELSRAEAKVGRRASKSLQLGLWKRGEQRYRGHVFDGQHCLAGPISVAHLVIARLVRDQIFHCPLRVRGGRRRSSVWTPISFRKQTCFRGAGQGWGSEHALHVT